MTHKILVIDDDKTITEIVKSALIDKNYHVSTANDGNEGLKQVRNYQPDLVVLDVMMPSMDGCAFIRALRALKVIEREQMIPVIVMTAKEEMKEVFKFEGVKEYLIKPVDPSEIIQKIVERLGPND